MNLPSEEASLRIRAARTKAAAAECSKFSPEG